LQVVLVFRAALEGAAVAGAALEAVLVFRVVLAVLAWCLFNF
jgi:hypothetical protein